MGGGVSGNEANAAGVILRGTQQRVGRHKGEGHPRLKEHKHRQEERTGRVSCQVLLCAKA